MSNLYSLTNNATIKNIFVVGFSPEYSRVFNVSPDYVEPLNIRVLSEVQFKDILRSEPLNSVAAIILGPEIIRPIQSCQLITKIKADVPILVVRTDSDIGAIAHRLKMVPGIGRRVSVLNARQKDDLPQHLVTAIQQSRRLENYHKNLISARTKMEDISSPNINPEYYLENLLENVPIGIVVSNRLGEVESANQLSKEIFGITSSSESPTNFYDFFPREYQGDISNIIEKCTSSGAKQNAYPFYLNILGEKHYLLLSCIPLEPDDDEVKILNVIQDVTEYTETELTLRKTQQEFHQMVKSINEVFWVFSRDFSEIFYISPAFSGIWGRDEQYILRHPKRLLVTVLAEDRKKLQSMFSPSFHDENEEVEFRIRRPDGRVRWIETRMSRIKGGDGVDRLAGVARDITPRKNIELKVWQLSTLDSLTGLLNRSAFSDYLTKELRNVRHQESICALMYLDLDEFKTVNDSLGHETGDQLIVSLAQRLTANLRREDIIGRFGGDEFVILINADSMQEISGIANKVLKECSLPFVLGFYHVSVSASIGIAIANKDVSAPGTLIQNADTAMYRAKRAGRNTYEYFNENMNQAALERLVMETKLRKTIGDKNHELVYQPKMDIQSGKLTGAEALIRFGDPDLNQLGVENVIKLSEETGFIVLLGDWTFQTVCEQLKTWKKQGLVSPETPIAVNLSTRQLSQQDIVERIKNILDLNFLPPELLNLELTETAIMNDRQDDFELLHSLHNIGLRISIDDFGTGYSSFSRLKNLPVSSLKIDQSFVRDITNNENDLAICRGMIKMAHELGLTVIAEGIETKQQFDLLKKIGCDQGQGYWISKPLKADKMTQLLKTNYASQPWSPI